MKCTIRGEGLATTFVVTDFTNDQTDHLAALGFAVDGATATRPVDEHSRYVEAAFHHLGRTLPAMLRQHQAGQPVPWQPAMGRLVRRLEATDVEWGLIGSAALAIRGVTVSPGDIDIVTTSRGADVIADLYRHELVFPVVNWPGAGLFGRAFDDCRVEWLGNDGESWAWTLSGASETIDWQGHAVCVPPLDVQLRIEAQRGRAEHVRAIQAFLDSHPARI